MQIFKSHRSSDANDWNSLYILNRVSVVYTLTDYCFALYLIWDCIVAKKTKTNTFSLSFAYYCFL